MNVHPTTAEDKKYQAESDMRTLVEAAKIKGDKSRHDAAMKMAREQRKALAEIAGKSNKSEQEKA